MASEEAAPELARAMQWYEELASQRSAAESVESEDCEDDDDVDPFPTREEMEDKDEVASLISDDGAGKRARESLGTLRREIHAREERKRRLKATATPVKRMTFENASQEDSPKKDRAAENSQREEAEVTGMGTGKTGKDLRPWKLNRLSEGKVGATLNIICIVIDWNRNDRYKRSLLVSDESLGYVPVYCTAKAKFWAQDNAKPGTVLLFAQMVFRKDYGLLRGYVSDPNLCIVLQRPGEKTIDAANNQKLGNVANVSSQQILMDTPKFLDWAVVKYKEVLRGTSQSLQNGEQMHGKPLYDSSKILSIAEVLQPQYLDCYVTVNATISKVQVVRTRNTTYATMTICDGEMEGELRLWKDFASSEHVAFLQNLQRQQVRVKCTKCLVMLDFTLGKYALSSTPACRIIPLREENSQETQSVNQQSFSRIIETATEFRSLAHLMTNSTFTKGIVKMPARLVDVKPGLLASLCCNSCLSKATLDEARFSISCSRNCTGKDTLLPESILELESESKLSRLGEVLRKVCKDVRLGLFPQPPAYSGFSYMLEPFSIVISDHMNRNCTLELKVDGEQISELTFSLPPHAFRHSIVGKDITSLLTDPRNLPYFFVFELSRQLDENGFAESGQTEANLIALQFK